MKVLYAIQATGNGHLSRALEIVPVLQRHCNLDIFVSGIQGDIELPFPVKYRRYGVSFIFGKKGGVDVIASIKKLRLIQFLRDVSTNTVTDYDLVISDFEPITAWSCLLKRIPCVNLSHQASFYSAKIPRPDNVSGFSDKFIRQYAPSRDNIAFHFSEYDTFIHPPIMIESIRKLVPSCHSHYTVYLPSVGDQELISELEKISEVNWVVFSKHTNSSYTYNNIQVQPICDQAWLEALASARGVIMGAGFEGPAEAIYLGKKLLVIPMYNQYEQLCNAQALRELGVTVIDKIDHDFQNRLRVWINSKKSIQIKYPDKTEQILLNILRRYEQKNEQLHEC